MSEKASLYDGHQKVVLEIDFSGVLFGYTELTIIPTTKDLRTIYLHSRQCNIGSVQVGGYIVQDWACFDPLVSVANSDITDCHRHPEVKRRLYSSFAECDEGELAIPIPRQVSVKPTGGSRTPFNGDAATPEPQSLANQAIPATEFAPIQVRISYSLRNPAEGFQFVLPSDAYPYRVPHAFTTPSSPDAARCWVPCLDNLWEKCTWDFEFIVPRCLEEASDTVDVDNEETSGSPTIVVCSGELVEKIAHPNNPNKVIYLFSQPLVTSVQHVAFAAGPFTVTPIPTDVSGLTDESVGSSTLMHAFCLPGHESSIANTIAFLRSAMNFYSTDCGSYPYGSYKLVFVDELPVQRFDSATLTLVSSSLLCGEDLIDQVFETRHVLMHALACQWIGMNITPKAWSDLWLVNGLGLYIAGLCLRKLQGNNEYRFRLRKDVDRVLELDNGMMPPICQPGTFEPPDAATLSFINLKAPLVLHILDRKLGKSGTSLGLSRVLPKIFLSALTGEMSQNCLSTHSFLRTCRKVSGVDLRAFVEEWIHGSGCPHFSFSANFNRKKMAVEIQMRQESPAYLRHANDPLAMALLKPVAFFEGQMTARIHEADGTPYEHVLDILHPTKRYEVPFNTKYKRVRRNTKRYLARQAAAQAAAEGDVEAAEAIGMIDMGFGLEVWENEEERNKWKVTDWTEEEEQIMAGATYEWIRMDADFEWLARVQFEQPDYMWVSQLGRDRDVIAQMEAVQALSRQPTPIVSSTLTKTVLVTNYFYRIRCEAAQALVSCATRRLDFIGLFHLFKLFLRYCYEPEDPNQDLFSHKYVPRPNDFSVFPEYFIRKALVFGISQVRLENGKTPPQIRQFFIDQLRYNDNTTNQYSDAYYIASLISALASASVSLFPPERGELTGSDIKTDQTKEDQELLSAAIIEVERYRSMDRLIPSLQNAVTVSALEFHIMLAMANLIPSDPKIFLLSTREGNSTPVRLAGFDGLFLSKWYVPKIMNYVLSVVANDSSRIICRSVARNMCESLALLASIGEIKAPTKENEALLIEEDGTAQDKSKESKKSETDLMIRALRKDREVGKSEVLRKCVVPVILDPEADYEVRWCMLKLLDLVVRGTDEPLPKNTIHIPPPPTPTLEAPPFQNPVTTSIKLVTKNPSQIKIAPRKNSAITQPGTPLTASQPPPKFRLPQRVSSLASTGPENAISPTAEFKKPLLPVKASLKKREKAVPKSQASGMTVQDVKACQAALKRLNASKFAKIFLQPVDPIRDKAPDYFEVIKSPMDLQTMNVKIQNGMYKRRQDFEADFRLMIRNCKTYNSEGTFAFGEAVGLETYFEKVWMKINATVASAAKSAPKADPEPEPIPSLIAPFDTVEAAPMVAPKLKLKLGSSQAVPEPMSNGDAQAKPAKPKVHKPRKPKEKEKATDMPPPPYIDDGSHDLLQEVIAMEELSQSPVKKESKHRREIELDPEDELLILASPSRDEDNASHETHPNEKPIEPPLASALAKKPKLPPTSLKIGRPAERIKPDKGKAKDARPAPDTNLPPVVSSFRAPVPVSVPAPVAALPAIPPPKRKSPPTAQILTPINESRVREVLKALTILPQSVIFLQPVDPIRDGCPTYYDEIEKPMDFGTIRSKLNKGLYLYMEQVASDIELIFSNCRLFNPPGTGPVLDVEILEKTYTKEWAKALEKKLTFKEKRSLMAVMTRLLSDRLWFVFWEPVDPVVLGIPQYHDIIPKRDARDLRTIRSKLETDKYETMEQWEADLELMVNNAIKFNGNESDVGNVAKQMQAKIREEAGRVRSMLQPNKKRPSPATVDDRIGSSQIVKKIKIG